jgi:sulfite dehydrogenase (cytochrome) subunit B
MKNMSTLMMALILLASTAYAQGGPSEKAEPQPGTMHSITLPAIRIELKEGEGRVKAETFCNICHSTDYITTQPKFPRAQWTATVNKMIKVMGAPISEEDSKIIINYLVTNYGTGN